MIAMSPNRTRVPTALWTELLLVASLVGLDVIARLMPHAPNFTPVAASALFAATVLRVRVLALIVPFAAMLLSDAVLGFYDWRVMSVVYVSISLPALVGLLSSRFRAPLMVVLVLLSCSLTFFATTNFAVWAFSGMYAPNVEGLIKCYIAALPFLQNTVAGDLFWATVLFGGFSLIQIREGTDQPRLIHGTAQAFAATTSSVARPASAVPPRARQAASRPS